MIARRVLPNRRLKFTYAVEHGAQRWRVDFGWDHEGKIRELFVAPAWTSQVKPDSARMRELEDTMILASFCLQTTDDVGSLARRFVRAADSEPLTLFERVLRLAVQVEPIDGPTARMAYGCSQPQPQGGRNGSHDSGAPPPAGA